MAANNKSRLAFAYLTMALLMASFLQGIETEGA